MIVPPNGSPGQWQQRPPPRTRGQADCIVPRQIYIIEAALHLVKGNLGPGLFAMPLQFVIVGPLTGAVTLAVVAVQGLYCMWLLVHTQRRASSCRHRWIGLQAPQTPQTPGPSQVVRFSGPLTFEELGRLAFGSAGSILVQFCVLSLQLGICAIYVSLVSENLQQPMPGGSKLGLSRSEAVLISYIPCLALSLLPDLSNLVGVSAFGTLAMLVALASVVAVAVQQLLDPQAGGLVPTPMTPPSMPPTYAPAAPPSALRPRVLDLASCAAAAFYAFEGMSIVLPVGNALSLTSRSFYGRLVVLAMGFVAMLFAVVAVVSALAFPGIDSASITAFLAARFTGTHLGTYFEATNLIVSAAVVATFPLQLTPAAQLFDAALKLRSLTSRLLMRSLVVTACAGLVLLLRDLSQLINLVGSVANTALAMLPALIHARLLFCLPGFRLREGEHDGSPSGGSPVGGEAAPERSPDAPDAEWVRASNNAMAISPQTPNRPATRVPDATGDLKPLSDDAPLRSDEWLSLFFDVLVVVFCLVLMATGVAAEAWGAGKAQAPTDFFVVFKFWTSAEGFKTS